jgi:hypothetical protein
MSSHRLPGLAILAGCLASLIAPGLASAHALDGKDPVQTGCSSNAYTVTSAPIYQQTSGRLIGRVYLRYSPSCGTNWAKVERYDGITSEPLTARIVRPSDGYSNTFSMRGSSSIYGNMAYAPNTCTYAWGEVDQSYASGSARTACF